MSTDWPLFGQYQMQAIAPKEWHDLVDGPSSLLLTMEKRKGGFFCEPFSCQRIGEASNTLSIRCRPCPLQSVSSNSRAGPELSEQFRAKFKRRSELH